MQIPPYRVDVRREADVIEDILRIYGFNNIEVPAKVNSTLSYSEKPDDFQLKNKIADLHLSDSPFAEKAAIEKQYHTAKQQNHRHKQQCPAPINAVVPRIAVLI